MIIRNSCFETNSSSTHALCIGKGTVLKAPFELIRYYKSGQDWKNLEWETIPEVDSFNNSLLPWISKNVQDEYKNIKLQDDEYNFNNSSNIIVLSRYKDIGRSYKKYETFSEKLNFIWSCLIYFLSERDSSWFKEYKQINYSKVLNTFINHLVSNKFAIYCSDIEFRDDAKQLGDNYNKISYLGTIKNTDTSFPSKLQNKDIVGLKNYGYFPIKELADIILDPLLFWNLVLGDSIIYTGSDECSDFEDLDFSGYIVKFVGGSDAGTYLDPDHFKYKLPKLLGNYINGNYETRIYDDGTRTRKLLPENVFYKNGLFKKENFKLSELDLMEPKFPESIDLKITNRCNNMCKFCYAKSNNKGKHGDLMFIKKVLSTMHPYTEVAIGGGNPLEHPNLIEILEFAKFKNIICNITLKDKDVINNKDLVLKIYKYGLIHSIGISPSTIGTLLKVKDILFPLDFTVHLILGIHGEEFISSLEGFYFDKFLILGFKDNGNGQKYRELNNEFIAGNKQWLKSKLINNTLDLNCRILSFDNLAIEQLNIKDRYEFKTYYQGNDGKFSFYIDAVKQKYSKSSLEENLCIFPEIIDLSDCLEEFKER